MKRPRFKLPEKLIFALGVIFLAIAFLIGYICKVVRTSDYFTVKEVVSRDTDVSRFNYFKGRNIFSLDLKREAWKMLLGCPDCSKVRISRVLPDRLYISFIRREPVALVKLYKYFALDEDATLFYAGVNPEENNLPVIYGLETKIFGPKSGAKYNLNEIRLALSIIREFKANRLLKNFQLKKIDLVDPENASFFILLPPPPSAYLKQWVGFEVKIGNDDISEKMVILGGLILQARKDHSMQVK